MEIERIIQYICTFLGVISLSFIYAQMFRKTKPTKKNILGVHCFLYINVIISLVMKKKRRSMYERNSKRPGKIKQLLHILIPIFITQAGLSLITFLDTVMSGKVSPADLAGVAIGSSL